MQRFKWYPPLVTLLLFITIILQGCSGSKNSIEKQSGIKDSTLEYSTTDDDQYRIRTGDEIELLVWEQPNFNTQTTVSGLGSISIPLIGEIHVTGLTKDELERELERRLSEYIKGEISLTLSIRNTDQLMVSVLGMVAEPNNYPVVEQTSIFRVLSTAGGPTPEANLHDVRVYRNNGNAETEVLDLSYYLDNGQMNSPEVIIYPGDIIYITEKENVVREMSEFLRDVVVLFGIFRVFR